MAQDYQGKVFVVDNKRISYTMKKSVYDALALTEKGFDAAEIKEKKNAILSRDEYAILAEDDAFNELKSEMDKYSVEDLEIKADVIFAKFVKANGDFASKDKEKKPMVIGFGLQKKEDKKKKAYGKLFDN